MTPYHKLPAWWDLCDAIRANLDDEHPRMVLADYVDENGHHDLANGIREAWREGAVYSDDYEYEFNEHNNLGGVNSIRIDFNRGFVVSVSCPHLNAMRRKLGELVRANIVLFAQCERKHAKKKGDFYQWNFSTERMKCRQESFTLTTDLGDYIGRIYPTDRDATIAFSRGLIAQAIEQNCDGTEGRFLSRFGLAAQGLEALSFRRLFERWANAPLPVVHAPPLIVSSESPSTDPT